MADDSISQQGLYAEHVALIKGDITTETPVSVRMHSLDVMEDVLGDQSGSRGGGELQNAMTFISEAGRGIVVLMREPTPTTLSEKLQRKLKTKDEESIAASELRDYGVGAQILLDLGIKDMILFDRLRENGGWARRLRFKHSS